MSEQLSHWQVISAEPAPAWFVENVCAQAPVVGNFAAQLLWQRGIQDPEHLAGFLNPDHYTASSPFEFAEMPLAIARLCQARDRQQKVAIWGDFDADGVTATAVLWEGLGQFFVQEQALIYFIPNRLTDSHGLAAAGIQELHAQGVQLIVTCDTGSTNLQEIELANQLGIDVIVTDHHTLPPTRPPVIAMINPRELPPEHPLAHLSGVAVAYKLVEALYQTLPDVPRQPLENLLDLVAIGLIADLVKLSGDCRYLAQQGIARLQQQVKTRSRPGVARLLELCKKNGDRPTDISFGLGPRINAVSRIYGDARFCVELLTSSDPDRCQQLAIETELANARRKALQKDIYQQVKTKLQQMDLSTAAVIVLTDSDWPVGILGLVAGQIAQEYGRPTILLRIDPLTNPEDPNTLAWGSARSVQQIDLYALFSEQDHLLHRYGGHPFAAGLSLPVVNLPLFTMALNQKLRQKQTGTEMPIGKVISIDLVVSVADLGHSLFQELKLLEPCGMGNPVPKLMIQNCWFEEIRNENIKDYRGNKIRYIKTQFELWDDSATQGFPGIWWEHYKDEVPLGHCDAVVELDFNTYKKDYEVRLVALRSCQTSISATAPTNRWLLDWRRIPEPEIKPTPLLQVKDCPHHWDDLRPWFRSALKDNKSLAIAYPSPQPTTPNQIWEKLAGMAKYLCSTQQVVSPQVLLDQLGISTQVLSLGLQALDSLGLTSEQTAAGLHFSYTPIQSTPNPSTSNPSTPNPFTTSSPSPPVTPPASPAILHFLTAVQEEQFRQQYFFAVPLSTMEAIAEETV
jgi:single-stranded-DNA-specific exonuclease